MIVHIPDPKDFKVVEKTPVNAVRPSGPYDVTVVTVVFNAVRAGRRERFVRCIESVQAQRGCRVEHLIVDGGSRDGTVEIVARYENRDVPIRYLSKPDHGLYDAMNRGIALSKGKYVVFLNSDDRFVDPEGMCASFDALEAADADYSYAPIVVVDAQGRVTMNDFSFADEFRSLLHNMEICHQSIVARREVLLAIDGFDLSYRSAADYDLLLRLIYNGYKGVRVEKRFVEFAGGGFSTAHSALAEEEVDRMFQVRLRDKFGIDLSCQAIRCHRLNLSWAQQLIEEICRMGELSFQRSLKQVPSERLLWETAVKWRLDVAFTKAVWGTFACKSLPSDRFGRILQCIRFAIRHPLCAGGAVKSWLEHRGNGALPLWKWMEIRCGLMTGRLQEKGVVVLPGDQILNGVVRQRSRWGAICTDMARITINRNVLFPRQLFVLLYPYAYREDAVSVDVLANGHFLGSISIASAAGECWGLFRLPSIRNGADVLQIELVLRGGGKFVFGGLCLACAG